MTAEKLIDAGCKLLMPWGAPIGTGLGLNNVYGLRTLRAHFAGVPLIIDAGLGLPSHAARAIELGFDAVLLNTAVAKAGDPAQMARAFAKAVEAGLEGSRGRPDGAERHGRAVDPGARHGGVLSWSRVFGPFPPVPVTLFHKFSAPTAAAIKSLPS